MRKTIAKIVTPDLSSIPNEHPHRKFARWLIKTSRQNPVEIFTVNYDVLIENALEAGSLRMVSSIQSQPASPRTRSGFDSSSVR